MKKYMSIVFFQATPFFHTATRKWLWIQPVVPTGLILWHYLTRPGMAGPFPFQRDPCATGGWVHDFPPVNEPGFHGQNWSPG
jgi:hypothetical protein